MGKNVLLTGGATGIGRATARRLVAEGARVFAVDVNTDMPDEVIAHVADVSDEEQVKAAVARAVEVMGGIDVLVNVAGIHKTTPLATLSLADFRKLLDVNLLGTFLFCREAMPHLAERKGVVINTASTSATHAHPFMTAYAASKGAVLAFSLSLAAEVAPQGVRVVAISPGGVVTPLLNGVTFPEDVDGSFYGRILPQIGFGEPEAIAGTIAFAASSDGVYLTGVELRVDGGSHV